MARVWLLCFLIVQMFPAAGGFARGEETENLEKNGKYRILAANYQNEKDAFSIEKFRLMFIIII